MAKKKNIVKKTKRSISLLLIVMLVLGWLLAAYVVLANNEVKEQNAMIKQAKLYLEDKLYIRAAGQYTKALSTYNTKNNITYETELLAIYKEAGMMEEYYALIDDRMDAGTALAEEYMDRAQAYIQNNFISRAMEVLQKGVKAYADEELTELYEAVSYQYAPTATAYTEVRMPSADWYIPASDGEHWGYIGTNGRTILDFSYEEATCFSGNYAVVKIDGTYTLIDKNGYWNAVDKNDLDEVTAISGTRIIGVKDGQYGIYTNTFNPLGNETYEGAYLNDNGLIVVKKDGKWGILDSKLKKVTDFQFTDVAVNSKGQIFNGNYAVVADESGYYLINQEGKAYFDTRFADAKGMEEGLFAVADDSGRWGFANEKAEIVVEYQYEDVYSFSNRLAAVKYAGKWGYINKYNTMVIEEQFAQAYPFLAGFALATDAKGEYRILKLKNYELFE